MQTMSPEIKLFYKIYKMVYKAKQRANSKDFSNVKQLADRIRAQQ